MTIHEWENLRLPIEYLTAMLQRVEPLRCSMDTCLVYQLLHLCQLLAFWEQTTCFECEQSYHAICMLVYVQITAQIQTTVFNRGWARLGAESTDRPMPIYWRWAA